MLTKPHQVMTLTEGERVGVRRKRPHPESKRLAVKNRMTIALGMICRGGLIIAADTRFATTEGFMQDDGCKVTAFLTPSGVFVTAYTSESGTAGETLVNEITADLKEHDPCSWNAVEQWLKASMVRWYSEYREEPKTQVIIGAFVNQETGLYFCQPPNTVNRNSTGYLGIGVGASVTDPLFRTLFGSVVSPHMCLREISYLMHRAKKENAFCGGHTDAVLLKEEYAQPLRIEQRDMAQAEVFGSQLDSTLARTATAVLCRTNPTDPLAIIDLANDIARLGLPYERLQFRSTSGIEIPWQD